MSVIGILLAMTGTALAQAAGGDPTAAFSTKATQIETISSFIGGSILGILALWLIIIGAMKGQFQTLWIALLVGSAVIVGTYSIWKPIFVGV